MVHENRGRVKSVHYLWLEQQVVQNTDDAVILDITDVVAPSKSWALPTISRPTENESEISVLLNSM